MMKSLVVSELRRYTRAEMARSLGISESEAAGLILRLRAHGYVRPVDAHVNRYPSPNLGEAGVFEAGFPGRVFDTFVFVFVGIIIEGEYVLKCVPKYLDRNRDDSETFKQILRVIEQWYFKSVAINDFDNEGSSNRVGDLAVVLFLMRDYFEHGLYSNHFETTELNGSGGILWDRTISESTVFYSGGRPVYTELVTRQRRNDHSDFFRELHQCLLSMCSEFLNDAGLLDIFDLSELSLTDAIIDDFGDSEYLLYRLRSELSIQFETRKSDLLNAMIALVSDFLSDGAPSGSSVFGTANFNLVWEMVCKSVFTDVLRLPIVDLPLSVPITEEFLEFRDLLSCIEYPDWHGRDEDGHFSRPARGTLEPDLVSITEESGGVDLYIFDAKYYVMGLSRELGVYNQPGIGDVTKQYLYQLALRQFSKAHDIREVFNCFLLPSESDEIDRRGHVSMDMLGNLGLADIQVRLLPASRLYSMFLQGEKLAVSELGL